MTTLELVVSSQKTWPCYEMWLVDDRLSHLSCSNCPPSVLWNKQQTDAIFSFPLQQHNSCPFTSTEIDATPVILSRYFVPQFYCTKKSCCVKLHTAMNHTNKLRFCIYHFSFTYDPSSENVQIVKLFSYLLAHITALVLDVRQCELLLEMSICSVVDVCVCWSKLWACKNGWTFSNTLICWSIYCYHYYYNQCQHHSHHIQTRSCWLLW